MRMTVIPIVIGLLGTVPKGLIKGLENLEIRGQVENIKTTALLRSTRILRRVLETRSHSNSSEKPRLCGKLSKQYNNNNNLVTSIHDRLALEMNRCLLGAHVPGWMTKGKTTWIQKDPSKGTARNNYRPITGVPIMWKISTAQIRKEIYHSLTSRGLFPEEQKGCRKGSRDRQSYFTSISTS